MLLKRCFIITSLKVTNELYKFEIIRKIRLSWDDVVVMKVFMHILFAQMAKKGFRKISVLWNDSRFYAVTSEYKKFRI